MPSAILYRPRQPPTQSRRRLHAVDALLAASLLLPLGVFGGLAAYDRARTLAGVERDLLSTLDTLQGHAEKVFQNQTFALGAVMERLRGAREEELRDPSRGHQAHLAALRRHAGDIVGLVVFGTDGRPLLDSERAEPAREVNVGDRDYFRHHQANADASPFVSGLPHSRIDGSPIFVTTARRFTLDGGFAGVVAAGTRQASITGYWDRAAPDPNALVALIRADGTVLARRQATASNPQVSQVDPPLAAAMRAGSEGTVMHVSSAGDRMGRLFALRRLERVPVYVAHGLPLRTALSEWRGRVALYGAFAAAAAAALFLLTLLTKRRTLELHDLAEGLEQRVAERTAELQAGEAQLLLLAREVDHRAKNALAVVQATLRLTPKLDTESYAKAVEGRVSALARAQTLLAQDRWRGASLRALLEAELGRLTAADGTPRVTLEGPPVLLPPEAAQPLALAMHELATNAAKHGALSTPDGRVDVAWRPLGTGDRLILRWVETGGPEIDQAPARRGFGSRVVEGVVRGQLGGTLDLSWPGSGLVCEISIPLARPSKSAGTVAAGRSAA